MFNIINYAFFPTSLCTCFEWFSKHSDYSINCLVYKFSQTFSSVRKDVNSYVHFLWMLVIFGLICIYFFISMFCYWLCISYYSIMTSKKPCNSTLNRGKTAKLLSHTIKQSYHMKILDFWDDSTSLAEWLLTCRTNLACTSPQYISFGITGGALELWE